MKSFLCGLALFVLAHSAFSETLVPQAPLIFQELPIFATGLYTGRSSLGVQGNGPSRAGLVASGQFFAFVNLGARQDPRESGWTLGFRLGASENHSILDKYLAAATSTAEMAIGRASISPQFERNSGIRGFLEMSYRRDQRLYTSLDSSALDSKVSELSRKNEWVGFKSGGSVDMHRRAEEGGETLARNFTFRTFLSVFIPLNQSDAGVFSSQIQSLFPCPLVDCGIVGGYNRSWGRASLTSADPIKHSANAGLRLERALPDYLSRSVFISFEALWTWIKGDKAQYYSGMPGFSLQISKSF